MKSISNWKYSSEFRGEAMKPALEPGVEQAEDARLGMSA